MVAAAAAGVLAGARSLTAIAEWINDAPRWVSMALGVAVDPFTKTVTVPHLTTVMRLLTRLDGDALDTAVTAFLQARSTDRGTTKARWRTGAVDGKQLRGSRAAGGKAVWLLAAMDHAGTVLGQRQIEAKSNETPAFVPLLQDLGLEITVITAEAAHPQHANGRWLREQGAHYIAVVEGNHPGLLKQLRTLPWADIALDHKGRTRGRGRLEVRHLKTVTFRHLSPRNHVINRTDRLHAKSLPRVGRLRCGRRAQRSPRPCVFHDRKTDSGAQALGPSGSPRSRSSCAFIRVSTPSTR